MNLFRSVMTISMRSLLVVAFAMIVSCGGSDGGTDGDGGGDQPQISNDFSDAQAVKVTGTNTDAAFDQNGTFTVGFTASDSEGKTILPADGAAAQILGKQTLDTNVTCSISSPGTITECALVNLIGRGGEGDVVAGIVLDGSPSMVTGDPNNDRVQAAGQFLDAVCAADEENRFGAFDCSNDRNRDYFRTRDLLLEDGLDFALPYVPCSDANVAAAKTAIDNQLGPDPLTSGSPIYTSVTELCEEMAELTASGGSLEGMKPAMLVVSDFVEFEVADISEAEACIEANDITVCTVGVGQGSEFEEICSCDTVDDCTGLFGLPIPAVDACVENFCVVTLNDCTVDADCTTGEFTSKCIGGYCEAVPCSTQPKAVAALKRLAAAGNCTYASARDGSDFGPLFDRIAVGLARGFNRAFFQLEPVPPSGTVIEGTLGVGDESESFRMMVP